MGYFLQNRGTYLDLHRLFTIRSTGTIIILKNGRDTRHQEGLDTLLGDKGTVALFPPAGGG
jgi:molybdopterin converting factor small subunit